VRVLKGVLVSHENVTQLNCSLKQKQKQLLLQVRRKHKVKISTPLEKKNHKKNHDFPFCLQFDFNHFV